MIARATRRWDGSIVLTFPFDRWLIETLKAEIPAHAREYDPARKAWTIRNPYTIRALELLAIVFPDAEIPGAADGRSSSHRAETATAPTSGPHAVLHLLPSAPPELVEAAYRTLARLNHPDAGGDTDTMQALNAAVATLRKRAG